MNVPSTIHWLVSRQMAYTAEQDEDEEEGEKEQPKIELQGVYTDEAHEDADFVGFNGRCNKRADTCYAFWVGAALTVSLLFPTPNPEQEAN
jgi:geranylgeranyl transferase type-1 subunit beta